MPEATPTDRSILITGGGTGIGRATALRFAAAGARVFLVGRREEPLAQTAAAVRGRGGEAAYQTADVADAASVRRAVAAAVERFGGLSVVVNSAGQAPQWSAVHETSEESWQQVLDVNLTGAFRVTRAALPHLLEGGGVIVNVSSISALKAMHSVASYSAAKAGLIAFSRCVAAEYGWQGVRCVCVVPSWVETPMTEGFLADEQSRREVAQRHALQRVASPDDVARSITHLASEDAAFVTGSMYLVDGGMAAL